jgi:hypothetical protein
MNGLDKFYAGLTKAFVEIYLPAIEPSRREMEESLGGFLLSEERFLSTPVKLPPKALFVRQIHWGVFEIIDSYESLLDAEVYIRRFPYGKTRITRINHIRYVFANHLSEVYILKERLKAYLQTVENVYAKGLRRRLVRQITQYLFTFNTKSFDEIIAERGVHVHKARYDDMNLSRLGAIERLSKSNPEAIWKSYLDNYFEMVYRRIRKEKSMNCRPEIVPKKYIDEYFDRLYPVIFDEKENLFMPD